MNATLPVFSLKPFNQDYSAFSQIGALYQFARHHPGLVILIDCAHINWLDSHLASCFMALNCRLHAEQESELKFINLRSDIQSILNCVGLFGPQHVRPRKSVIPIKRFDPGGSKDFAAYTQENFSRMAIPRMSEALQDKFFEGIDELFSNAELHSKTKNGIFACGQHFPKKKILDFTVVDMGIGFQKVLLSNKGLNLSPEQSIDWAMRDANTTRTGDIPGGLGLKILKQFIKLNKGKITIVSSSGYWCMSGSNIIKENISNDFPGTAVIIEVNTADNRSYYLQ